jgi:signal transduction protein with GAF and PtsI domain
LSTPSDEAHRRAEAQFKQDQQAPKGQQRMAEYQANLDAMREKTARLRALRLARDATNKKRPLPTTKGAA